MKRKSLSQAKNVMRRALDDLVEPPPTEADQARLRQHFGDRCCYCEASAPLRDGHIDHAEPDGGNGLGNLLLACKMCNGDEKREASWEVFLRAKCAGNDAAYASRRARIDAWLISNPRVAVVATEEIANARAAAERAIEAYAAAYARLREAVAAARRTVADASTAR